MPFSVKKFTDLLAVLLMVIFGLLYIAAKIHFFTRYSKLGPAGYLEEHWVFWAAMALVGAILACVRWVKRRTEYRKSV
jgi:TRAP-type C4-dicarboxylate transport system permease small subunit